MKNLSSNYNFIKAKKIDTNLIFKTPIKRKNISKSPLNVQRHTIFNQRKIDRNYFKKGNVTLFQNSKTINFNEQNSLDNHFNNISMNDNDINKRNNSNILIKNQKILKKTISELLFDKKPNILIKRKNLSHIKNKTEGKKNNDSLSHNTTFMANLYKQDAIKKKKKKDNEITMQKKKYKNSYNNNDFNYRGDEVEKINFRTSPNKINLIKKDKSSNNIFPKIKLKPLVVKNKNYLPDYLSEINNKPIKDNLKKNKSNQILKKIHKDINSDLDSSNFNLALTNNNINNLTVESFNNKNINNKNFPNTQSNYLDNNYNKKMTYDANNSKYINVNNENESLKIKNNNNINEINSVDNLSTKNQKHRKLSDNIYEKDNCNGKINNLIDKKNINNIKEKDFQTIQNKNNNNNSNNNNKEKEFQKINLNEKNNGGGVDINQDKNINSIDDNNKKEKVIESTEDKNKTNLIEKNNNKENKEENIEVKNNNTQNMNKENEIINNNLNDTFGEVNNNITDNKDNKNENNEDSHIKANSEIGRIIEKSNKSLVSLSNNINNKKHIKTHTVLSQTGKEEEGKTKINQDSYLELTNLNNNQNFNVFGIFDGHGTKGHLVSQFISNYLKNYFTSEESPFINLTSKEIYEYIKKDNYSFIINLIKQSEEKLFEQEDIESNFSGTTCNLVIHINNKIICSNIGDSRSIMVKDHKTIIQLSYDQKPDDENEKKRIEENNGEVHKLIDEEEGEIGPMRVFMKGEKFPGIAMSRSIGDRIASKIGVFSLPEIREFEIEETSKFIVMGSDGIWEFLTMEKVTHYVNKFYRKNNIEEAAKKLVKKSREWWEKEDTVIDDITVIIIFFDDNYYDD